MEAVTIILAVATLAIAVGNTVFLFGFLRRGVKVTDIDPKPPKPYALPKPTGAKLRPRAKDDARAWLDEQEEKNKAR